MLTITQHGELNVVFVVVVVVHCCAARLCPLYAEQSGRGMSVLWQVSDYEQRYGSWVAPVSRDLCQGLACTRRQSSFRSVSHIWHLWFSMWMFDSVLISICLIWTCFLKLCKWNTAVMIIEHQGFPSSLRCLPWQQTPTFTRSSIKDFVLGM